MKILFVGGTRFLGRALVDIGLERGHEITLFNRGKSNPNLYPSVKTVIGDRDGEISKLGNNTWDVVIDTCGYVPRIVSQTSRFLKGKVKQYIFISTISVYKESEISNRDEDAEVIEYEDPTNEEIMASPESYGGLKVLCEREVQSDFAENSLVIRPGLIIGPHDPTNRFTYWPVRIRKGGHILAPGDGTMPIQIIDVRDLAAFTLDLAERGTNGVFNATGEVMNLANIIDEIILSTKSEVELTWLEDKLLLENEVGPWMEMPLWIPSESGRAMMQTSIQRGLSEGLSFRPLKDTIHDTLEWYDEIDGDTKEWSAGLSQDKEAGLLNKYKN